MFQWDCKSLDRFLSELMAGYAEGQENAARGSCAICCQGRRRAMAEEAAQKFPKFVRVSNLRALFGLNLQHMSEGSSMLYFRIQFEIALDFSAYLFRYHCSAPHCLYSSRQPPSCRIRSKIRIELGHHIEGQYDCRAGKCSSSGQLNLLESRVHMNLTNKLT